MELPASLVDHISCQFSNVVEDYDFGGNSSKAVDLEQNVKIAQKAEKKTGKSKKDGKKPRAKKESSAKVNLKSKQKAKDKRDKQKK